MLELELYKAFNIFPATAFHKMICQVKLFLFEGKIGVYKIGVYELNK